MYVQHLTWQEAHSEFPIHVSNCHYLVRLQFKPSELEQVPCPLWAEEPMVGMCFILILETRSHHEKQLTVTEDYLSLALFKQLCFHAPHINA